MPKLEFGKVRFYSVAEIQQWEGPELKPGGGLHTFHLAFNSQVFYLKSF